MEVFGIFVVIGIMAVFILFGVAYTENSIEKFNKLKK